MANFLRGKIGDTTLQFFESLIKVPQTRLTGFTLPIPEEVKTYFSNTFSPSDLFPNTSPLVKHIWQHVISYHYFWRITSSFLLAYGLLMYIVPLTKTINIVPRNTINAPINLRRDSASKIAGYAERTLREGRLEDGLAAVEELLNRNDLSAAETSLRLITQQYQDSPSVNFYNGRLAWQFIKSGDKRYSIDDSRRYWEQAVKLQPDSILYNNVLGFAHYERGNVLLANDSWFTALSLLAKAQNLNKSEQENIAYMGLALGLYTSAPSTGTQQAEYLYEAIKLRDKALSNNTDVIKIQSWLWTNKIIKNWESLVQLKN